MSAKILVEKLWGKNQNVFTKLSPDFFISKSVFDRNVTACTIQMFFFLFFFFLKIVCLTLSGTTEVMQNSCAAQLGGDKAAWIS